MRIIDYSTLLTKCMCTQFHHYNCVAIYASFLPIPWINLLQNERISVAIQLENAVSIMGSWASKPTFVMTLFEFHHLYVCYQICQLTTGNELTLLSMGQEKWTGSRYNRANAMHYSLSDRPSNLSSSERRSISL